MASDRQFSWRRSVAWAVSLAAHLVLLVAMTLPRPPELAPVGVDAAALPVGVPVDLPDLAVPADVADRAPPVRVAGTPARAANPLPRRSPATVDGEPRRVGETAAPDNAGSAAAAPAPVARTVVYLDDEARAILPQEALYSATPAPREGDYYTPGDGSEDDVLYRPRALDPNPSRFAHAWRPRGSLIDDWLGQLVEKASGKVSIPLNAKFSLVCGTVAGIAGGCTIVRNGGTGVIVQRPPPAPWDRSNRVQCRELREALEAAEEAAQVAYYLDRLTALCSANAAAADTASDAMSEGDAGNDEARRGAGLPGEQGAPDAAPLSDQRDL